MEPAIYIHGGAGNDYDEILADFRREIELAMQVGYARLAQGASALDAVEAAVRAMEDAPVFDAGHCSYPNRDNEIEMDAMVMEGRNLGYGAVAAIQRVANPVQVARLVLEKTPHCLIVGAGAEKFARTMGIPEIAMEELLDPRDEGLTEQPPFDPYEHPGDTVGAVAIDANGDLAVAVSTGGTRGKLPGRVGDSPLIGSGGYAANNLGAAVATGHGEALMKVLISKTVCDWMGAGQAPQAAAQAALDLLVRQFGHTQGGVIVMNPQGEVGAAFNTHHMARAYRRGEVFWVAD